jgi:putative glutamine amidotransferase
VFGAGTTVLCSHHQAVRDLGRGLVVTARAGDGVVEAVELPSARFVLAVQWHPEEAMDQRPFDALLGAAKDAMEKRPRRTTARPLDPSGRRAEAGPI